MLLILVVYNVMHYDFNLHFSAEIEKFLYVFWPFRYYFLNLFNLFSFCLHWAFVAARRLSLVVVSGGHSSLWRTGFSLQWLLLLQSTGSMRVGFSSCGSWALEPRLSSCGARAQLLHGMWDLPRPGLKPVSPALAGGSLTTAPPGKAPFRYSFLVVPCQTC